MRRHNIFQNIVKRLGFILAVVGTTLTTSWAVMADCSTTCSPDYSSDVSPPCGPGQHQMGNCCCYDASETKGTAETSEAPVKGKK